MAEQIASLEIAIDSRQTAGASDALRRLEAAANAAAAAAAKMAAAHEKAVSGTNRMAQAANAATASTKQLQEQIKNLGFQMNDIVSGVLSGQSLFQIMTQQGGQVYQALNGPGGVSAGLKNVADKVVSMATPARAVGVALAAAATIAIVAWNRFESQQLSLIGTVKGLGREAGLSVEQLRRVGEQGAARGGLSQHAGVEFAQSILETNAQINPANIEKLVAGARDFSAFFTRGDLQDGQKRMLELLQGSGQSLLDLDKRYNILSSSQRKVVEDAIRYNNANQSVAVLLDVINSRSGLHSETTGKIATAWERIGVAVSDIMTKLGPLVNNLLTPLASLLERAAKGLESPNAAGNIADVAAGAAASAGGPFGAGVAGAIRMYRSRSGPEYGPPIPADLRPQTYGPPIPAPPRPGVNAYSPGDPLTISERGPLSSAGAAAVEALTKKLNAARGAVTELATAQNNQLDPSLERVRKAADDVTKQVVPQEDALKNLNAQSRKLAESLFETGQESDADREASSRLRQAIDSQTDATGKRITSEQLYNREANIRRQQITDMTVDQRAQTAVEAETLRLVGAGIPVEEARRRAADAGNLVRIESNQQITLGNRELEFSRQQIELEGRSLLATAQQRAQANAELAKEQELRRAGRDPGGVDEQVQIRIAGEQARLKQRQSEGQQQFDNIKQAGVSAFTSIATAIASGTNAMDAMTAGAKQLGSALTSGGINQIAQGNFVAGGVEAVVGLGLSFFGADREKKKAQRQKQIDDAKTQADEAARKADEINQAISTYLQRITAAAFAGQADTLQNRLAQFDARAQQERLDAMAKGGAAINLLEQALGMERANIVTDWNKKIVDDQVKSAEDAQTKIDAILQRQQSAQDRIFAAGIDTNTFAGKVAALERQFQREREDEIKAGGEAMTDLLAAQDAERLKLLKDNSEEWLRNQKAAFDDAKNFLTGELKSISSFLSGLLIGGQSPLAPLGKLTAAQSQFSTQLALAQSGNRDALSGITGNASALLEASRGYYGSTSGYQTTFAQVQSQLGALPSQVSPEQFIVNAINKQTDDLSQVFDSIDVNQDGVISATEANGTFLQSIFNELDTNGDGMLQKSELIRINTGNVATSSSMIEGYTNSNNTLTEATNTLNASMYGVQATMSSQLNTQIQQLSTAVTQLILMTKVVWNTAQLVTYTTNGFGSPQYARGGYVDGLGTDTSDSNTARLSRGEFVMRASAVREHGRGFFDRLNSGGSPIIAGGSPELLAELKALRAEVAQLRAVTAAGAEHVREGVDNVAASQSDTAREIRLQRSRK